MGAALSSGARPASRASLNRGSEARERSVREGRVPANLHFTRTAEERSGPGDTRSDLELACRGTEDRAGTGGSRRQSAPLTLAVGQHVLGHEAVEHHRRAVADAEQPGVDAEHENVARRALEGQRAAALHLQARSLD